VSSSLPQFSSKNKNAFFGGLGPQTVSISHFYETHHVTFRGRHRFSFHYHAFSQGVVAPGATLEKLAGGFAFTEGATCDKNGNVFFVDQPNDRIMEWSADGKLSTFMQPSGYANGMISMPTAISSPAPTSTTSSGPSRRTRP
jgi:hypothetical protein